MNIVRPKVSRQFRDKDKENLKAKIEELETESNIKNIRDMYRSINDFKKGYYRHCISNLFQSKLLGVFR
jgi:hypothetical protein